MATREELIASSHGVEEIRAHIGADSLGYLSTDGLAKALGVSSKHFCWACLTGRYPIVVPADVREARHAPSRCAALEEQDGATRREPVKLVLAGEFGEDDDLLGPEF
jgi:hypothetical protein